MHVFTIFVIEFLFCFRNNNKVAVLIILYGLSLEVNNWNERKPIKRTSPCIDVNTYIPHSEAFCPYITYIFILHRTYLLISLFLDYSDTKVIRILNSELADTLGNLLSRCCGSALNPSQLFPEIEPSAFKIVSSMDVTKKLIDSVNSLPGKIFNNKTKRWLLLNVF